MNPSSTSNALRCGIQKVFDVQSIVRASVVVSMTITTLAMGSAEAGTTIYTDRPSFETSLGASVIDDYSNPGYKLLQSNAVMSSVLGETDYASTGFLPDEINIVGQAPQGEFSYCAGCNGSFILSFTTTSVGTQDGVFGVGFEFINALDLYVAFVTFGDGSQKNIVLPVAVPLFPIDTFGAFFGITSDLSIKSIAIGLPNGQATNQGTFGIDNLTIGKPVPGPLPLLGIGAALGFSRKLRKRTKSAPIHTRMAHPAPLTPDRRW
jgi:hypothetical protein